MKNIALILSLIALTACSERQAEEFVFRKTIEYKLKEHCEDDQECLTAVETQLKGCIESSDWRSVLDNQDDEAEQNRFARELYACLQDTEGNPYFETSFLNR